MVNARAFGVALAATALVTAALLLGRAKPASRAVVAPAPVAPLPTVQEAPALRSYIEKNAPVAKTPEARDRLGAARVRLGYAVAKAEGFAKARPIFVATAKAHEGGAQSAAFGGVADQAAYQAVVCLVGEGKEDEARRGFEAYLRERPLSPLVHAAYRRLARLNGGESRPEWDDLLQKAVSKQEARIRFETSVCGPKCLERLTGKGYKELAKLCGTTDSGTTVEGMRKGLKALGKESWAARLNREDLGKARLPAIVLQGDHYVVLERIEGERATVWDPRYNASTPWKLPPLGDPDFSATVILLSKPEGL